MFRFSIRQLMLVTLIVAMGLGWWMDRSRLAAELDNYTIWDRSPGGMRLTPRIPRELRMQFGDGGFVYAEGPIGPVDSGTPE